MCELRIHKFADWDGNEIFILREDLIPLACGGNKVRIALKLLVDAKARGATHIVGYGNSRSNLCRVLSMLCASQGFDCTIVSPSDDDGARVETTNSRIVALSGANVITCPKSSAVSAVVKSVIDGIRSTGGEPYYIFGNEFGSGNERVQMSAYEDVAEQLITWQSSHGLSFDRVALAVGTGSTYAGLLSGLHKTASKTHVTGFTIARDLSRCMAGVAAFTDLEQDISDVARAGGYGKTTLEELDFIADIRRTHAILLDPTYSGKALWGLSRLVVTQAIRGEKILFIHTGSLPLAIDGLKANVK